LLNSGKEFIKMAKYTDNSKKHLKSLIKQRIKADRIRLVLYSNIDSTPVKYYHKAKEGDITALIKEGKEYYNKFIDYKLYECLDKMIGQIVDEFGVNEEVESLYHIRNEINKLEIQAIEGDRSAETFIQIAKQREQQLILSLRQNNNITQKKAHSMERLVFMREFHYIDDKITVFDFYFAINQISKSSEEYEPVTTSERYG
jgi:hypothetical protein